MYGVSKENTIKFMQYIVNTNGSPTSAMARECGVEDWWCEWIMRNPDPVKAVEIAKKYLGR